MSDPFVYPNSAGDDPAQAAFGAVPAPPGDEERPPSCPACNRRLVILATHTLAGTDGKSVRRQLWGCPRGHATSYRTAGLFSPIELLPDVAG